MSEGTGMGRFFRIKLHLRRFARRHRWLINSIRSLMIFSAAFMLARLYGPANAGVYYLVGGRTNTFGKGPQPLRHTDQIRQGLRLHLSHDLPAMNLGGGFTRTHLSGDLFV